MAFHDKVTTLLFPDTRQMNAGTPKFVWYQVRATLIELDRPDGRYTIAANFIWRLSIQQLNPAASFRAARSGQKSDYGKKDPEHLKKTVTHRSSDVFGRIRNQSRLVLRHLDRYPYPPTSFATT